MSWVLGSELGEDDGRFGVLNLLDQREGRAASRAELIRHLWGTSYLGSSNVVDAVVRTLRRKLGGHAHLVKTVRGVGYRLASRRAEQPAICCPPASSGRRCPGERQLR
ncbi:MAG: winged helix-turn-helix domain-containing protein [Actinobacteria bacterium]|nr:winged helix-turn-helix domain-containing protein [Actinomycetota bacterium]